uniref:MAK10-like protein n=1 Tax=Tanacetum cinerariifolium TaxID=118510 RepID=A0A6L2M8K6_TANCI|nr:MAK10-like protein [Tanacetum cinerariifolium]
MVFRGSRALFNTSILPIPTNTFSVIPFGYFTAVSANSTVNLVLVNSPNPKLRERTRLRLFQFSLRDQVGNWLERLLVGSISTLEDLTTRFLAQTYFIKSTIMALIYGFKSKFSIIMSLFILSANLTTPPVDEAFARQLEAEMNAKINWNDVLEQVKRKEKQDNTIMRYQDLKRKPMTEARARKNMVIYLKNMVGFKMHFFKGMTYNDIRPIFENHYNSIKAFLNKGEEEIEEEGSKRKGVSHNQDAAKK